MFSSALNSGIGTPHSPDIQRKGMMVDNNPIAGCIGNTSASKAPMTQPGYNKNVENNK
jgi:hypothetical protein